MSVPTLTSRWQRAVDWAGERRFLTFDDLEGGVASWTYAEFDGLVREVAARLHEAGARPGCSVQAVLGNSPAFVATWLACARLGATFVPSDPRGAGGELAREAERTDATVAVCRRERAAEYADAATGVDLLAVDEIDPELTGLRSRAAEVEETRVPGSAVAAVMFTSGSTSEPKGVMVTQANYAFAGSVMAAASALSGRDRCLIALPLFHANAQYYSLCPAITVGAEVTLLRRFTAGRFLEVVHRYAPTHVSLFAAPIRMILARTPDDASRAAVRHCWFAQDLSAVDYARFAELLGCRPRQLYGMTETLPAVFAEPELGASRDAIGWCPLGCDADLRAVGGDTPVAAGEEGEITVGGRPGIELFAGYLDDERATAAAFRGGRFRTGDRGVRDESGRVRFTGRHSDVLKVAGENVATVEVERVLMDHPGVADAAVVGAPDPLRDEVPVAHVVRADGRGDLADGDVLDWCRERLAPAKRPRAVVFHDELPRTSVGKIRKFLLRAPAPEKIETTHRGDGA